MEIEEGSNDSIEMKTDSDSSSSSEDDEAEQGLVQKAEELERQISDNKYLYDAHQELVGIYQKLGDLKSMRLAYERFCEYFPLTPQLWLSWINSEKNIASSDDDSKFILGLFEKAVQDYLSVNLWIEYAQYSISATNLETTRNILEKGLTAAGLHASEGGLLWDTLRELEFAHLSLHPENSEPYKEQVSRIVEVFRRQLSVPLIGMENTYAEWQQWLENLPNNTEINREPIEWGYKKALKTLEPFKPFEQQLLITSDETELLKIYKNYTKIITDPSTILCVYERAVAQMCLSTDIWMDYCLYAVKLGEPADKISQKALRNCTWSEDLWVVRLRILEKITRTKSEILSCFEQGVTSVTEGIDLWLTYIEYIRRNSDNKDELHKLFDQAIEQLQYKNDTRVTRLYARILAREGDIETARKLWKSILKDPSKRTQANVWMEYVNLEKQHGDSNHIRSLFQRALNSCTDWPQYIADEFLMFEQESGSLDDVLKCVEKCRDVVKVEPKPAITEPEQSTQNKSVKRKKDEDEDAANKKHKQEHAPLVRRPQIVKDPKTTVFVSNLYPSIGEKRLKKFFPSASNIEIVTDRKGNSRCYGYVQFSIEEQVQHALARDRELLEGRPIFISACKPDKNERKAAFKYSVQVESNKLFVRGLPVDKSQEEIEAIFKEYGAKNVRLVLHRSGKPKGLAYVEFEDDKSAQKALEQTDNMKIGAFTISVAISAPPVKTGVVGKKAHSEPVRHARSKLQVPLIPRSLQVKTEKSETNGSGKNEGAKPKSNADFRQMLLNK